MEELLRISSDARVTVRRPGIPNIDGNCVLYWMQRSQRAFDNHALDVAVNVANAIRKPVAVFLAPIPYYPRANWRHYAFLQQGIPDIASGLRKRNVGFVLRTYPDHHLLKFCAEVCPCLVIGDENPLREPEHWREVVQKRLRVPFWTVDSDVIVPTKLFEKEQFAAYTIRPRIRARLQEFLKPLSNPSAEIPWSAPPGLRSSNPGSDLSADWPLDRTVRPVGSFLGGSKEAIRLLRRFVADRLPEYSVNRNHPETNGTSKLSPYLHFGHIGPHTVALAALKADVPEPSRAAFLEELIVRRELAINFVRFNANYESIGSAPNWAGRTLAEHAGDQRPIRYSEAKLEAAETHDPLWNAAQIQMVETGWMHNYMRMYWAKKLLEWSPSAAEAYHRAVRLNDKYELDGRDPNGYEGIAWAIVGKSDRAWFERPIFGKIRYMSFESTSRKFDSKRYIREMQALRSERAEK